MRPFLRELIVPGGMIVLAIVYALDTAGISSLAKLFPYSILALLVVFSVVEAARQYRLRASPVATATLTTGRVATIAAASVLFVAAIHWLGVIAAAAVFMAVSSVMLGAAGRPALVVSAVTTAAFYGVFVLGLGLRL